jgi:hypothetical protein
LIFEQDGPTGRAGEIALAYYCLWPLFIARGVKLVDSSKRRGMRDIMERIVLRYEVRHGVALMEAGDPPAVEASERKGRELGLSQEEEEDEGGGDRPLWCGPWGDSWMEGVWEWTFLYGCGAI